MLLLMIITSSNTIIIIVIIIVKVFYCRVYHIYSTKDVHLSMWCTTLYYLAWFTLLVKIFSFF